MRTALAIGCCTVALFGCGPKSIDVAVNVVSGVCDPDLDPFQGVNVIEVRVSGAGIETPLLQRSERSSGTLQIPDIPAGADRVIEVRGLAESSAARPLSIGRSLPFSIPDVITETNRSKEVNIFMRRIDTFTPPSAASAPRDCARMRSARAGHTATLLKDGRVFIAGGFTTDSGRRSALYTAEIYDPAKGAFEDAPGITAPGGTQLAKAFHTATLLVSGQVLLHGGETYNALGAAIPTTVSLVFDPGAGGYGLVPPRTGGSTARTRHLAIRDAGGRVLIVGGVTRSTLTPVAEIEWFDPTSARLYLVPSLTLSRVEAAGAAVNGGEHVIVAGGVDEANALSDSVNFYRFDGNTYVQARAALHMSHGRRAAAVTTLSDDKTVLLMGGYSDVSQIVPDPSSEAVKTAIGAVEPASATIGARGEACAALLPQGSVLAIGGRKAGPEMDGSATLIRYDTKSATLTASAAAPVKVPRYLHTCTTLADGSVLVTGGMNADTVLQDAWIYTPIPAN